MTELKQHTANISYPSSAAAVGVWSAALRSISMSCRSGNRPQSLTGHIVNVMAHNISVTRIEENLENCNFKVTFAYNWTTYGENPRNNCIQKLF
jgi:hypothetical protein